VTHYQTKSKNINRWKVPINVYILIGSWVALGILSIIPMFRWLIVEIPILGRVERSQERYAVLREDLPPDKPVGYVSDIAVEDFNDPSQLAQYAITPVVLRQGADCCELVIGDFLITQNIHPEYGDPHLTLLIDYGNGVILYRNEDYAE
jgi:hypothetical protein